jgi:flavin-binding protein dodecin
MSDHRHQPDPKGEDADSRTGLDNSPSFKESAIPEGIGATEDDAMRSVCSRPSSGELPGATTNVAPGDETVGEGGSMNEEKHPPSSGKQVRAFVGISEYRDVSTAESLHEAIQAAAQAAARQLELEADEKTELFEVSRIQVQVGNPNVKAYRVVLTPAGKG